eukprot:PhF_6_TR21011/c3_g1_i3/m.30189
MGCAQSHNALFPKQSTTSIATNTSTTPPPPPQPSNDSTTSSSCDGDKVFLSISSPPASSNDNSHNNNTPVLFPMLTFVPTASSQQQPQQLELSVTAPGNVSITLRSYGTSFDDLTTPIADEVCHTSTMREATEAVKKALEHAPMHNIIVAGIPMSAITSNVGVTVQLPRSRKDDSLRCWLDTSTVEVRFDDPVATADAYHLWNHIRGNVPPPQHCVENADDAEEEGEEEDDLQDIFKTTRDVRCDASSVSEVIEEIH